MTQLELFEPDTERLLPLDSRVYIAGPMTGVAEWNFPLFFSVERALKREGYRPINPARNDGPTLARAVENARSEKQPWAYYMRRDLRHLSKADAVCLLPGWQDSKGAVLERHIAEALGMPVFELIDSVSFAMARAEDV